MTRPTPPPKPQSFTYTMPGLAKVLLTPVHVGRPIRPDQLPKVAMPTHPNANAIWDTGATSTVISERLAVRLGLKPIGMVRCKTVGGERDSSVYLASLFLPNGTVFPEISVCEGEISGGDLLVGMDVIACGDFAVSNFQGKTTISFRCPSAACIDFQKGAHGGSPNRQCECGSGKKHKHCCGKA